MFRFGFPSRNVTVLVITVTGSISASQSMPYENFLACHAFFFQESRYNP